MRSTVQYARDVADILDRIVAAGERGQLGLVDVLEAVGVVAYMLRCQGIERAALLVELRQLGLVDREEPPN